MKITLFSSKNFRHLWLFIFIYASYHGVAFARTDHTFTWATLTSEHFQVHYHQGEEALAQRAIALAEDIHAKLVPRMQSAPRGRTHIVLADAFDDANGWATTMPYRLMTLYVTPPLGEPGFGAHPYDDWMRLLITHEYTHIVQMDMTRSAPDTLRDIFGNLYLPNMWQPRWLLEGLSVHEETALTGGGRNRSPASDMVLRMAVLEDNFPPISHAASFTEKWPAGEVPYLFGGSFTEFLAGKYGRERLADVSLEYSGRWWPFLVSSTAYRTLGTDYPELWEEWKAELVTRYEAQRGEVQARGLSASRALTASGYRNLAPAISPDGKRIAYFSADAHEHPAIRLMDLDGGNDRVVVENETLSAASLAWAPDGSGLYFTRTDAVRNANLYNDLYFYDLQQGSETRLTHGLRARDASPAPDHSKLVFVANRTGKTRLGLLALPAKEKICDESGVQWLTPESDLQYETPRYSPDGQYIVVGVRQPDGHKDIWLLDGGGNKLEELMHDRAIDGGATWSADGSRIYFASDRSGIFNLYTLELASKRISQVSNVLGGAFMPSVTPDGQTLAFVDYSSRGYDIHTLDNRPAEWVPAPAYRDLYPDMQYDVQPVVAEPEPYSPLATLAPRFWFPNGGYSAYSGGLFGLLTFGSDAVERHSYVASVLYGPDKHRTWYDLNYRYDGLYPGLVLRAQDIDMGYAGLLRQQAGFASTSDYLERSRMFDASLEFPLLGLERQQQLTLGYRNKGMTRLTTLPPWAGYDGVTPAEGRQVSARTSYLFNNAKRYGYSISPEDGRSLEFGYELLDRKLGSDFSLRKFTADWHEYIDLPFDHHVLLLRGYGGRSFGDVIPQRAFQLGGDTPGDLLLNVTDTNVYLRGYPVNAYRGQNVALLSAEYRFPIANIERGGGNTPFFFKRVHGAVFAEGGSAWDSKFASNNVKRSVGFEGRMDMAFAYGLPVTLRAGIVQALDDAQETSAIVSIWLLFL